MQHLDNAVRLWAELHYHSYYLLSKGNISESINEGLEVIKRGRIEQVVGKQGLMLLLESIFAQVEIIKRIDGLLHTYAGQISSNVSANTTQLCDSGARSFLSWGCC